VSRIWRAFGLKPHLVETWKLSTDPEFIAKVRDVVGLHWPPQLTGWPVRRQSRWSGVDRRAMWRDDAPNFAYKCSVERK
jgi:hypothetical protein